MDNKIKPIQRINAFTIDVEDYFQVEAFQSCLSRTQWDSVQYPSRVLTNTYKLLELLDSSNSTATFFILGWIAEKFPHLVKEIHTLGHEVASHGYAHQRATTQSKQVFFDDILKAKWKLEELTGSQVIGYRAPSFSFDDSNPWVYQALHQAGYIYSSSTYPIKHDIYGVPHWPRFYHQRDNGIIEIPIPTFKFLNKNLPIGGGGYFRFVPYKLSKLLINQYLKIESEPYSFYCHPWEIDPNQPIVKGLSLKSRYRHYVNLHRMQNKIEQLLNDYSWGSIQQAYSLPTTIAQRKTP